MKTIVPGIPPLPKRPEGTDTVIVGEVEQNVAEAGDVCVCKQQSPSRRKIRIPRPAASQPPHQVNEPDDQGRYQEQAQERVGESAMMGKGEHRPAESAQNIKIGRLGSQSHGGCGQRGLAIETGASHARAGQEVCDWFQIPPKSPSRPNSENTMPVPSRVNYVAKPRSECKQHDKADPCKSGRQATDCRTSSEDSTLLPQAVGGR